MKIEIAYLLHSPSLRPSLLSFARHSPFTIESGTLPRARVPPLPPGRSGIRLMQQRRADAPLARASLDGRREMLVSLEIARVIPSSPMTFQARPRLAVQV